MGNRKWTRGIFCLEGEWNDSLERPSSVEPVLEILNKSSQGLVPYIRRDIGTMEEFGFYLDKALQARYKKYPILYLAFHGEKGQILVGDQRKSESKVTLGVIEGLLAGRCKGRIVHFGACDTMDVHGRELNRFLRITGALAVSGYTKSVDWIRSAAFDMLLLDAMQYSAFNRRGILAMQKRIKRDAPYLAQDLGFRMVVTPAKSVR